MSETEGIYRTPQGAKELDALYEKALLGLGLGYDSQMVETRFGATHLLSVGPKDGAPVLVLQGGNTTNPCTLSMYPLLAREFRLLAPDTIGHPGRSAQRRISPDDHSFGEWVVDILDGLGLERVPCLGTSYGAGILLRTAAYAPERIAKAVLVVPSGLVKVRLLPLMTRLAFPILRYLLHPKPETLAAAVRPLHTAPIDQVIVETTGAIFRGVRLETRLPRPVARGELLAFTAPALVLAAEKDVFFPARAVIPAAREVIPNLVAEEIIGCGHLLHPEALAFLNRRIRQFLWEKPSGGIA